MKITKKIVFYFVLLFLFLAPLALSMLPFAVQSIKTPPGQVFMGLHRWSEDYYSYLHLINQGIMGHLETVNKITSQPHVASFVHSEYAFLGLIGGIFGFNSALTYHLSRLFLGAIFLLVTYYFFLIIFKLANSYKPKANSHLAFFLAFFVGGFPHILSWQPFTFEPYLSWWVELDATRRSTILPHYLMGDILMLLVLMIFLRTAEKISVVGQWSLENSQTGNQQLKTKDRRPTTHLLLAACSFLLAFVHPVDFALTMAILGIYSLLTGILKFYQNNFSLRKTFPLYLNIFVSLSFVLIPGIIPILYFKYIFTLPFYRFVAEHGATTLYNIPLGEFILALGPVFLLAISYWLLAIGRLVKNLWSKSNNKFSNSQWLIANGQLLMFSWLLVQAFFFFYGYKILNFDRLRTLHAPFFIPLAFFTTLLLLSLEEKIISYSSTRRFGGEKSLWKVLAKSDLARTIIILLIIVIFLITLPLSIVSLRNQVYEVSDFKSFSSFTYPSAKVYDAFLFLKNNTPQNSLITTGYEAKFLLPAVAGNRLGFGNNFEKDPVYQINIDKVNQMYQGILKGYELENFLKRNNIKYIFWGYQEKSYGADLTKENFLQKIFENSQATIFKVK